MVGWHHWFNRHEFEQAPGDGEGQGNLACCSPQGHKELDMTEWLNNKNLYIFGRSAPSDIVTWCCSVAESRPTLCNLEDCSTPGSSVLHYPPEFAQIHVHWVSDTIWPSDPLAPLSPFAFWKDPSSGSFPMSKFFTSGGHSILALATVFPTNVQDWFPLGLTGLISLPSKGLSRVLSNTTVQMHQFFGAQLSL